MPRYQSAATASTKFRAREDSYDRSMIRQIVEGDLALYMAGDDFKLLGWVMQQDVIDQNAVLMMCPKFAAVVLRRQQPEVPLQHFQFRGGRLRIEVPR